MGLGQHTGFIAFGCTDRGETAGTRVVLCKRAPGWLVTRCVGKDDVEVLKNIV